MNKKISTHLEELVGIRLNSQHLYSCLLGNKTVIFPWASAAILSLHSPVQGETCNSGLAIQSTAIVIGSWVGT